MTLSLEVESHLVVVDARPRDYRDLPALASDGQWHLHCLTTGRALTTFIRRANASLWIVNANVSDATGAFLLQTVREYSSKALLFVVSDRYDAEHEWMACQWGAALYLCKDDAGELQLRPFLAPSRLCRQAVTSPGGPSAALAQLAAIHPQLSVPDG
jgi:DNA-binding response OmpR family regulator